MNLSRVTSIALRMKPEIPVTVRVNGESLPVNPVKGYVSLNRSWHKGDAIELNLPMPVRRVKANSKVQADAGRVALQRGPLVYCAEWPDNPNGKVRNLLLPNNVALTSEFRADLLNGVEVVRGKAISFSHSDTGASFAPNRISRPSLLCLG
jgi:DUF1680 family protein